VHRIYNPRPSAAKMFGWGKLWAKRVKVCLVRGERAWLFKEKQFSSILANHFLMYSDCPTQFQLVSTAFDNGGNIPEMVFQGGYPGGGRSFFYGSQLFQVSLIDSDRFQDGGSKQEVVSVTVPSVADVDSRWIMTVRG